MLSKVFSSFADALVDVKDGSSILLGGFGPGTPHNLIDALHKQGAKNLTLIANALGGGSGLQRNDNYATVANLIEDGRVGGVIASLTPSSLVIDRYEFAPDTTLRIDRRGDPTWDGALKGAAWGVVFNGGLIAQPAAFARCIEIWSLVGWPVDVDHVGRTTIFQQNQPARGLRLAPISDRDHKGVALAFRF